jgi:ADP-dependent NAD(P)H-hydrate dehydratase / NAD(P)H-hydrate epimerase
MLPILNADQVRNMDAHTMINEPITSVELMERAATACAHRIIEQLRNGAFGAQDAASFLVLAGMGNNGGDGLVIARLLHGSGCAVRVVRIEHRHDPSPENLTNWQRLERIGVPCVSTNTIGEEHTIGTRDIIVDALIGVGLTRPLSGGMAEVVRMVRASRRPVISIDLPSGLFAEDNSANDPDVVIRATWTLTFEVPKLALLLSENARFVGEWELVPVGWDRTYRNSLMSHYSFLEEGDVIQLLKPRPRFGHKGTFGHALIIAGSLGRMGAAVLATRAALRSGAGLVSAHVPAAGQAILQGTCPEAMCSASSAQAWVDDMPNAWCCDSVGLGPGLGVEGATALVLKKLIQEIAVPLVLDADGLNILAENRTWLSFLPPRTIITPHPKEFDRLVGSVADSGYQRLERAQEFARKHNVIVVLKGAWTAICDPNGQVYFNSTGNPGMAKGGSGDALTGLITGLLAQGYAPLQAAQFGVYLHGLAGDIAAAHHGMDGMTASDVVMAIPEAWMRLRNASFEAV